MKRFFSHCVEVVRYHYTRSSSERFIRYLRGIGVAIGEGVIIYEPKTNMIDETRPCLVTIGNDVDITRGVIVLTHGSDWHVIRGMYGRHVGSAGPVTIKDNVFIGVNAVILKDVTINENCIIGAGSVVTRDVPAGSVVAGNPAKVIMGMEEYYGKRQKRCVQEAGVYARAIYNRYGRLPEPGDFKEFFDLFIERDPARFGNIPVRAQMGKHYEAFLNTRPMFRSFEEFLEYSNVRKQA